MGLSKKSEQLGRQSGLHALALQNARSARRIWATSRSQVVILNILTREFQLSVAVGDLMLLEGKWYVTPKIERR